MVQGIEKVRAQFASVVPKVVSAARAEMEVVATQIVSQMRMLRPIPEIVVDWTWGRPPSGSVTLGSVARSRKASLRITIYANAVTGDYPGGFPAVARWHEFGTAPRFRKSGGSTGQITASPYFFPVYRANRRRARTRISNAIRKAVKSANP